MAQSVSASVQYDSEEDNHYLVVDGEEHGPFSTAQMEEMKRVMQAW